MSLVQKESGIPKTLAKRSSKAIIVKHELNLVYFQVRHYLICLNEGTANDIFIKKDILNHYLDTDYTGRILLLNVIWMPSR